MFRVEYNNVIKGAEKAEIGADFFKKKKKLWIHFTRHKEAQPSNVVAFWLWASSDHWSIEAHNLIH